jgi:hypothetical protein
MGAPLAFLVRRLARRYGPIVAEEIVRRWRNMTPEEKERYRQMAQGYVTRGRTVLTDAQERRRRRGEPPGGPGPGAPRY